MKTIRNLIENIFKIIIIGNNDKIVTTHMPDKFIIFTGFFYTFCYCLDHHISAFKTVNIVVRFNTKQARILPPLQVVR